MKKKSIFRNKFYAHFDTRKSVESVKKYIYNPKKVKEHSFFPFIFNLKTNLGWISSLKSLLSSFILKPFLVIIFLKPS